ncbi:heparinase [Maritimibacter sp. 55A14]|uniref:heparinase II/III family protein n=1 Tax=Maritimibacter sp. 55A14 TaxID=2174844 RepID=UPI000D6035D8|nr:heparinase II/III family protein [Maritimibacter sp. 55A14]PWE29395.1 heparinase [Maritimibacter sp. 55A14]
MSETYQEAPSPGSKGAQRWTRGLNRLQAGLAGFARPATAFVSQPEPRTIGSHARGRQLLAGNFMFGGHLIEAPGAMIWNLDPPEPPFEEALHGFTWLDDLAAVGDSAARQLAQDWLREWIARFGAGRGPGWTPDTTGRRIIRWINHAVMLLGAQPRDRSAAYFRCLTRQTVFLGRRWRSAAPGLPRFEALTGLVYAGLALEGMDRLVAPATRALAAECRRRIGAEGGLPTRNPEELLEVFTLLTWASAALSEAGQMPQSDHLAAIERIAPTLRALRHADGGLARFHGGGRGLEGRLDHALAAAGVRAAAPAGLAMGYARLSAGRTSLVMDAAAPPPTPVSYNGHASTLAFELTSGRRPLIVNCGAGGTFGEAWRRAGRATPSHSTLTIDGFSSSRLGPKGWTGNRFRELLVDQPGDVRCHRLAGEAGTSLLASHDGYAPTHGLTHVRRLTLSADGRNLAGEDTLGALSEEDRMRFEQVMDRTALQGVGYALRFHLHPDVDATLDMGGTAVSMMLKSGEIWVFRHDGAAELGLERSVYLEKGRLKPRATKQIVLSSVVMDYASRIGWSLAKAQETPTATRDVARDEEPAD